jgi:thiamine pyrophosphate-dependent acetolactate synthase large subunit-like protein
VNDTVQKPAAVETTKETGPVDLSIPYDAAAKLAYEASSKTMTYEHFRNKYNADAVKDVIAKRKKK